MHPKIVTQLRNPQTKYEKRIKEDLLNQEKGTNCLMSTFETNKLPNLNTPKYQVYYVNFDDGTAPKTNEMQV